MPANVTMIEEEPVEKGCLPVWWFANTEKKGMGRYEREEERRCADAEARSLYSRSVERGRFLWNERLG